MSYELESSFETEVIQASFKAPIVVDFWAPWCGPCQALGPTLEKLVEEAKGKWNLVKINTEAHPAIAQEYQIASIPAVKLFVNGKVTEEFAGALPEGQLREWLKKALPSASAANLKHARELIDHRKDTAARAILDEVLAQDPNDEEALLLKAELEISTTPDESEQLLSSIRADSDHYDRARALRGITEHLKAATAVVNDSDSKGKAAYLDAIKTLSDRDYEKALEHLIKSIEADRRFREEAAINLGKFIFQWLGVRHPIADRFYRRFTSVLYV